MTRPLASHVIGRRVLPNRPERDSDVLVDQMLAWDNDLFRRELGAVPEPLQDLIREAVTDFLDLG